MKRISLYLLGIILVSAGCQKKVDDLIDGQTVDQRLSAALAQYQNVLTSAPYGWILLENSGNPNNGGQGADNLNVTFAYYMQFNDQNQVVQFSDFDTTMLTTPRTSGYRIKAIQRPTLIFDTYGYIHVPCDPDPSVSKTPLINTLGPGAGGLGWGTDFEFEFSDSTAAANLGDSIHLLGLANQSTATLIKATKAQHDTYVGGTAKNAVFLSKILNYFKRVTSSRLTFEITPAASDNSSPSGARSVDISWVTGTRVNTIVSNVSYVGNSLYLSNPIGGPGGISSIDNIVWNQATSSATATVLGTSATIAGAIAPIKNDTTAPGKWWLAGATTTAFGYWTSFAFHVNGVDTSESLSTIPNYLGEFIYIPGVDTFAGAQPRTFVDGLLPVFLINGGGAIDYGLEYRGASQLSSGALSTTPPTFKNGLFYFNRYSSDYGTIPSTSVNAMNSLNSFLVNGANGSGANGWYLILKDDGINYDMVTSTDAKAWIKWR